MIVSKDAYPVLDCCLSLFEIPPPPKCTSVGKLIKFQLALHHVCYTLQVVYLNWPCWRKIQLPSSPNLQLISSSQGKFSPPSELYYLISDLLN